MKRHDSGWRDPRINLVHAAYDVSVPLPGMSLLFVEYDRGEALAVINYIRRDVASLPKGPDVGAAYAAVAKLRGPLGTQLPFLTVQYDPRNWAMQLFGHNDAARDLIGTAGWQAVTETHFVRQLYRLRGRQIPDLASWGVDLSTAAWIRQEAKLPVVSWPGQDMSVRRRDYEPEAKQGAPGVVQQLKFSLRNPCADIDLAVVGAGSGHLSLLVDFKLEGAHVDPKHKTHQALSGIYRTDGRPVPSMITRYDPTGDHWTFSTYCLNEAAEDLLTRVMTSSNAVTMSWLPDGWTHMREHHWYDLLDLAKRS